MPVFPSNTLITDVLNLIKNDTPFLALYTATPGPTGGGTEVTGGSYSRKSITFGAISAGSMSNSALITYAGLPSATITHYGILDAATGGNLLVYGALNSTAAVISGDQVQIPASGITINLTGS